MDAIKNHIVPMEISYAAQRGYPLVDVYSLTEGHTSWFADPVHPNPTGYQQIANLFYTRIQQEAQSSPTPTIGNQTPTGIGSTSATLNGNLSSTGECACAGLGILGLNGRGDIHVGVGAQRFHGLPVGGCVWHQRDRPQSRHDLLLSGSRPATPLAPRGHPPAQALSQRLRRQLMLLITPYSSLLS